MNWNNFDSLNFMNLTVYIWYFGITINSKVTVYIWSFGITINSKVKGPSHRLLPKSRDSYHVVALPAHVGDPTQKPDKHTYDPDRL